MGVGTSQEYSPAILGDVMWYLCRKQFHSLPMWGGQPKRDWSSKVQDSLCQSCQSMTLSTGLWPRELLAGLRKIWPWKVRSPGSQGQPDCWCFCITMYVIHDASLNFWVILSDVYHLLPARRPKGWWVHPSKSNSPPFWTRCPELRSTGVRPLGGNRALRNLEVKKWEVC